MEKKVRISEKWLSKLKEFEGLRLTAYKCAGGKMTIGYGHLLRVGDKQRISAEEAHALLLEDVAETERQLSEFEQECKGFSQGQWDALVSFSYNVGTRWTKNSTIANYIRKDKECEEIGVCFDRWCYANGVKLQGLFKRRQAEKARYYEKE